LYCNLEFNNYYNMCMYTARVMWQSFLPITKFHTRRPNGAIVWRRVLLWAATYTVPEILFTEFMLLITEHMIQNNTSECTECHTTNFKIHAVWPLQFIESCFKILYIYILYTSIFVCMYMYIYTSMYIFACNHHAICHTTVP
jgi:hypothetical protein